MTTHTLTGFAIYYDTNGDTAGVDNTNAVMEFVVPDATTSFSYTVNPPEPGDGPGDETIDATANIYALRINGEVVGTSPANDPDFSIFEVVWTDGGGISRTSTVMAVSLDTNVSGLGLVNADYIFVLDGTPLPTVTTPGEWDALDASLTSISVPTGAYGPGVDIPLTSLGGTVSENDIIPGTSGNDVLRGGAGDDEIHGMGGNDRLFGGDGDDRLFGGDGNDFLNPGDNTGFDIINTGAGRDKVVLSGVVTGYVGLEHWDLDDRIIVDIDGNANTGTIRKTGNGITTIIDVKNPMLPDPMGLYGLGVSGTSFNDVFRITVADSGWMQIRGGAGKDKYELTDSTGAIRLNFNDATGNVTVNLATGKIRKDGFGNTEFITGTGQVREVRSGMHDDRIIGSDANESFILMAGTDVLNGGDGFDRVRYDRFGVDGITVDLDAEIATGFWRGEAFSHTLRNIEHVRGSNGNDNILGSDTQDDRLEGRNGDDVIEGGFGNDTLLGGNGNDRLWGDRGNDLLQGEAGNDKLWGEWGRDRLEGGDGRDRLSGGDGNDRLLGGKGNDKLIGGAGNDKMTGGGGVDTFVFGDGADKVTDFNAANNREKIDLRGVSSITDFSDLTTSHLTEVNGHAVITDADGNSMTLTGVAMANLDAGDFIF